MMTARDPYVNIMRGAIAAFSAGLGGADSVCVLPHTLAVGLPDGLARRLARNGQLMLLRESNLGFVADPAAGAGGFEALTQALAEKGWAIFQEYREPGRASGRARSRRFQRDRQRERRGAESAMPHASKRRSPASPPIRISTRRPPRSRRAPRSGSAALRLRARSRRCGLPSRSKPLRDRSDAYLSKTGVATESLSCRARPRARASPPRRLHARMVRSRRDRADL